MATVKTNALLLLFTTVSAIDNAAPYTVKALTMQIKREN